MLKKFLIIGASLAGDLCVLSRIPTPCVRTSPGEPASQLGSPLLARPAHRAT
jgi:hypothetical protein